jgi:carbon-monoxide dehydrogenase large subunit
LPGVSHEAEWLRTLLKPNWTETLGAPMNEKNIPSGLERRLEDYKLITGLGNYVDDLQPASGRPLALYMSVVRSPYAHAEIKHIQLEPARALPGVIAALEGAELVSDMPILDAIPVPGLKKPPRHPMALQRVRYVGDPVVIVLAENPYIARDARDLVEVDYDSLPATSDPEAALAPGAPLLYEELGTNVAYHTHVGTDNSPVFDQADHIVRLRLVNQRLMPGSIEPRASMFDFDPTSGELAAWMSSQAIFRARQTLSTFLHIPSDHIRVHNAEVGGAFGAKNALLGEEIIAASMAVRFSRPVKWIEDRSENFQSQTQGRGQVNYIEVAFQNDGRLLGLRVRTIADLGAFLAGATAMVPHRTQLFLSGPYQVQEIDSHVVAVYTNKVPTAPYRGAGRPEATYILERTMDRIAHELGLDPAEVRRRNFIAPEAFPYTTATGITYDSGNYQLALDRALDLSDYANWREQQRQRRQAKATPNQGGGKLTPLLGIGLTTFIEQTGDAPAPSGSPHEAATVRILCDGTILVQSGVAHTGQGHFTAFAQIAAQTFHVPASKVEVHMNDTSLLGFGIGTYASRTAQVAGTAVLLAAESVCQKALRLAAHELEVAPADLLIEDGYVMVRGVPDRVIELGELARLVEEQPDLIEHEQPNPANGIHIEGLAAWHDYAPPNASYASGTHIAVVEVDTETGEVHILKYVAVDDCGRVLNPYLAEAQIHGSIAQGIGQALYEGVTYDQEGQLLTGNLLDYSLPLAHQVPDLITELVETPSPLNPLGVKGVGESGCLAAPPTIVNAVLDALAPLGITTIDMPLTPEKIWPLIQSALHGTLEQPEPRLPALEKM